MILLVDNTIDGQGVSPVEIKAAMERVRPDLSVRVEKFKDVSLSLVREISPSHIILSGQSHPWTDYSSDSLAGVFEVIHKAEQPIFGVCGGHQQIALAYGAKVDLMRRIAPGEGYDGAFRERGYFDIEANGEGLFAGLPKTLSVWHSHCDEVKDLPEEFNLSASNETCRIQAMQHKSRPVFGVQFHPDLFDQEHPHGRRILENFLAIGVQ